MTQLGIAGNKLEHKTILVSVSRREFIKIKFRIAITVNVLVTIYQKWYSVSPKSYNRQPETINSTSTVYPLASHKNAANNRFRIRLIEPR